MDGGKEKRGPEAVAVGAPRREVDVHPSRPSWATRAVVSKSFSRPHEAVMFLKSLVTLVCPYFFLLPLCPSGHELLEDNSSRALTGETQQEKSPNCHYQ